MSYRERMEDWIREYKLKEEKASRYAAMYGGAGQMAMDLGFVSYGGRRTGKSDWATSMAMAMAAQFSTSKYIVGIDPITEGGESLAFTGALTKELGTKTERKMKRKNFYHTFEYEGRTVTLCLAVREEAPSSFFNMSSERATTQVGYAVCVPEDTFSEELAKKISLGRAESKKANIQAFATRAPLEFAFDLGILNATARIFERKIKRGEVVIKGIRPLKKEK